MKTTLLPLCLFTLACTPMNSTGSNGNAPVPSLSSGAFLTQDVSLLDLSGAETLDEAAAAVQQRFSSNEPVEGGYTETLNAYQADSRGTVVLTQDGLPDDSVSSVQYVVEFDLRPDTQVEGRVLAVATGYGTRQKCARAADPLAWTNAPCP